MGRFERPVVAGLLLASCEWGVVFATAFGMFLTPLEVVRYLVTSWSVSVVLTVTGAELARFVLTRLARRSPAVDPGRRAGAAFALVVFPVALALLSAVSGGRRVASLPARWPAVGLLAVGAAAVAFAVGSTSQRLVATGDRRRRARWAASWASIVPIALLVDALVLKRLYPAFHLGLDALALSASLLAATVAPSWSRLEGHPWPRRAAIVSVPVALGVSLLTLLTLRAAPNLQFVVSDRAPLTGRIVAGVDALRAPEPVLVAGPGEAAAVEPMAAPGPGFRLPDPDILLITVDALRADRLRAYGGRGLTPSMDALADAAVVFRRAYTPTPHTSYALTSMLTGKYLRAVLELPQVSADHPTLPSILRRYGHRTAAFYPPAIFHVDGTRFASMQEDGFGFEYRKEMYATAEDRVHQLATYLDAADSEHPVFAWVHLFEPHEPYDPDPRFERGDTAEARYDGEVAAADAAIGALVRVFRAARPGGTVILAADHGEEFGDHGGHHHGTSLYDEQIAIPLLWSSPGLAHRVVEAPVELVDVATTVLGALAIPRDARMRGDDLTGALIGGSGPRYAFAEVGDERMVTDGRYKAICGAGLTVCRLYDLVEDPHERRNLAPADPERVASLRAALSAFIGSIPEVEALAIEGEVGWPEALARAELGDATAAPEVLPLLSDPRPSVRAAAARALGGLRYTRARPVLARLRASEPDPEVRAELAMASLTLGDHGARGAVEALISDPPADPGVVRRSALLLASVGDAAGLTVLRALAADRGASEDERLGALEAIGALGSEAAAPATYETLIPLLEEVRLRPEVARVLGALGNRQAAAPALRHALESERYVEARACEAEALVRLGDSSALRWVRRFLGTEIPLPGGVRMLLESGALTPPSGRGADLRAPSPVLDGALACDDAGCRPEGGVSLRIPRAGRPHGAVRLVLALQVKGEGTLAVDGGPPRPLAAGPIQTSVLYGRAPGEVRLETTGDVRLVAFALVPRSAEIPPPPPEPWEVDGGVGAEPADQGPKVTLSP